MTIKKLLQFINLEDKRLIKYYGKNLSPKERVLARTVKLAEELGELCNEILASSGDQRKDKLKKSNKKRLSEEFADVIITTLLVAKSTKVNIKETLEKKISKINNRYK